MSNIIFIKYSPFATPKLVPKIKCSEFIEIWQIYYFKHADLYFNVKNSSMKYLPPVRPKLATK